MKISITGTTGFIGKHLVKALGDKGDEIVVIGRHELSRDMDYLCSRIAGSDAVIHLAGAPINKRWTAAYKEEIVSSRVHTTNLLVQAMEKLEVRPGTFISTSAIGAFDSEGQYTEASEPNAGDFLGQLSRKWEAAARKAEKQGVRTLIFRLALVLGPDGGLMKQLLMPFRLGLGGPVGDGKQHFSWIHIDDLVNAYMQALDDQTWSGVYHLCAPHPVTNRDFTRSLGAAVHRPALLRVPGLFLKLAFGEGADVMTSGQRVISERLPESGFRFQYPDLEEALQSIVDARKLN